MTFGTFPYLRKKNKDLRSREYLTEKEVEMLIDAAKQLRYSTRNQAMLLIGYRHALRPAEVCGLRWDQVLFEDNMLHITRKKNGVDGIHPIHDREIRLLKKLLKENKTNSSYLFLSQKGGPVTVNSFQQIMDSLNEVAKIPFKVHPHMLRHSLPTKLSGEGINTATLQAYVGHRNIANTARYIHMSPAPFQNFFRD